MRIICYFFFAPILFLSLTAHGQEDKQFRVFLLKINSSSPTNLESIVKEELSKYKSTKNPYYHYNSKFTQSLIERKKGNFTEGIRLLIWIDEQCQDRQSNQIDWVRYEIASNLSALKATKLSQEYALPLTNSKRSIYDKSLRLVSHDLTAYNFFELKDYKHALIYYERSLSNYRKDKNWLMVASMLNNIGICHLHLHNNNQSLSNFKLALSEVSKANQNSIGDFKYTIIGNIGTCYDSLKMYPEALTNLKVEFNYYLNSGENHKYLAGTFNELIQLYISTKNVSEATKLIHGLEKNIDFYITEKIPSTEGQTILSALINFYTYNGDKQKELTSARQLLKKQTAQMKLITKQTYELNEILFRNKLTHLKSSAKLQRIEARQSELLMQLFVVIFSFGIIILLGILIASIRYNRQKKEALLKDNLIAQQNAEILKDDLKRQQEKTNNLALYLNLKKETEKAFLTKIAELKRQKNTDSETILKDLQISVSNLVHVDKKAIFESTETNDLLELFKKVLSTKHPLLTKTDLAYCCYFRLNMSAKEIGSLFGQSDVSIRVMKNKIKNKIGLSSKMSLNDYLISINN